MPGKRISDDLIQLVYFNYCKKRPVREIAEMCAIKQRTVYNIIYRAEKEGRLRLKYSPGRRKKFSDSDERLIMKKVYENPFTTTRKLTNDFQLESGATICHETVRKILIKNKYLSPTQEKPTPQQDILNIKQEEAANTPVQLFADDAEEIKDESSDEEENLVALKRYIIRSEHIKDTEAASTCTNKRRRMLDSDDDDEDAAAAEPQQKIYKIDEEATVKTEEFNANVPQSETYVDEDGFVIMIKSEQ